MNDRPRSGVLVGALAGALSIAAHGFAGGDYPDTASLTVLTAVCGLIATLRLPVVALLALGQLGGHTALSVTGHGHWSDLSPTMVGAHVVATLACAALLAAAMGLYRFAAATLRALTGPRPAAVVTAGAAVVHDLLRARTIAGSVSPRGPPVIA